MRRSGWVDLLTYLSVIAVLVVLVRGELLRWPRILDPAAFAGAFAGLAVGFLASTLAWRAALGAAGVRIPLGDAFASCGLSVFGKYVPGKVWLIAGMAGHVARRHPIAFAEASAAATRLQVISLWIGLGLGLPALLVLRLDPLMLVSAVAALAIGSAWLAFAPLRACLEARAPRLGRIFLYLWPRSSPLPAALIGWLVIAWLAWGIGFALLVTGLTAIALPGLACFVFPFAAVVGLLVLIAPGGIGAREGVLALALSALALSPEQVASVAVFSRVWFLVGEAALFATGVVCQRSSRRSQWAAAGERPQRRRLL